MRWYYRLATVINPIFLLIIRSFPPARPRVRVLVYNLEGKILLVKSAFGMREWELPGGAAHYRESQEAAAARELYEETSVKVVAAMLRKKETRRAPFPMVVFETRLTTHIEPRVIRPFEVREAAWFSPDILPEDTAEYVRQCV